MCEPPRLVGMYGYNGIRATIKSRKIIQFTKFFRLLFVHPRRVPTFKLGTLFARPPKWARNCCTLAATSHFSGAAVCMQMATSKNGTQIWCPDLKHPKMPFSRFVLFPLAGPKTLVSKSLAMNIVSNSYSLGTYWHGSQPHTHTHPQ